jgi:hypothetical protein
MFVNNENLLGAVHRDQALEEEKAIFLPQLNFFP